MPTLPTPQPKRKQPPPPAPPLSPPPPRKRPRPRLDLAPPPPTAPTPSAPSTEPNPPNPPPPPTPNRPYTVPCPAPNHIRIYAWNVNGIWALLRPPPDQSKRPNHHHHHHQPPITSFLTHHAAAAASSTSTRTRKAQAHERNPDNTHRSLRARLRRWKYPEVVCLQEVQIALSDTATQRAVQEASNPTRTRRSRSPGGRGRGQGSDDSDDDGGEVGGGRGGPTYTAYFGLARSAYNARGRKGSGKMYGVATLLRDDFAAGQVRVAGREVGWDGEGRVLGTELRGGVLVLNVYAVNGTEAAWRDEGDGRVVGTRHDKKRAVHEGLVGEWEGWVGGMGEGERERERMGREVCMIGDMNVARDERDGWPGIRLGEQHVRNRVDFERKFFAPVAEGGLGAVDTFREVHGAERRYSYFPTGRVWGRSCDRVDLGVVSKGLVDRGGLVGADSLDDPMERASSDHVPLYVVLKVGENTNEKNAGV